MTIVALELSTGRGSVAWDGFPCPGGTGSHSFQNDRKHSGLFFEHLEECLEGRGAPKRIVVGLGPGSYAGTRIAAATALGLRAACGAKLVGIPSLCALDTTVGDYLVIGDARRDSFFCARVMDGRCVEGPALFGEQELRAHIAASRLPLYSSTPLEQFPEALVAYPCARRLTLLANQHPSVYIVTKHLEPIYLRDPHITIPRPAMRLSPGK
jgi:tRNA threonylcarbamoyladenosine biosynthesis protein TsaB